MQEQIKLLIELQKVDAVLGDMKRKREFTPKRLSELQSGLEEMKEGLEKYNTELDELKRDKKTKEGLLQMEIDRIHKTEGHLKDIKTQKEYQALLKEVEQGKKLNVSREEDILKLTADVEEMEKISSEKTAALKAKEADFSNEKKALEEELSKIDSEFDGFRKGWEEIAKKVKPNVLKMYQRVSEKRNATSVVPVKNGACTGCHMNLPPQLYNQIQKGHEMLLCPSCHRILYWEANC